MAVRGNHRVSIGNLQPQQLPARLLVLPHARQGPHHLDRLAKMRDRLLERRATKREIARLAPVFDLGLGEARLREVMSYQFRFSLDDTSEFFAQGFGDAPMQDLPPGPQQAFVSRVLHERVLEAVARFGRGSVAKHQLGFLQLRRVSVGAIAPASARAFGLPADVCVAAGTTDGCASFLATGAKSVGDGVTALGTTLTLKLLSDKPTFAPRYGVYSHRLLDMWLAGGASNSGGAALLAHFPPDEIEALTPLIDPDADTGLDYYPLTRKGERFPIADPDLPPRMALRPKSREKFLQAILEGIASIEALGYRRLAELGAPALVSMRTVGGGARNPPRTCIRARKLGVPFIEPISSEAAYGAALLAMRAWGG